MAETSPEVEAIREQLESGSISAEIAMQKLVALMRNKAEVPGAKELYQEASQKAYDVRQSSLAHSHPPPPMDEKKD